MSFSVKADLHGEHLLVGYGVIMGIFPLRGGEEGIGSVDTHLAACIDPLLSFPEFDQPGFALVVKIDGLVVEDHLKKGRCVVKKYAVVVMALPCVDF